MKFTVRNDQGTSVKIIEVHIRFDPPIPSGTSLSINLTHSKRGAFPSVQNFGNNGKPIPGVSVDLTDQPIQPNESVEVDVSSVSNCCITVDYQQPGTSIVSTSNPVPFNNGSMSAALKQTPAGLMLQ